MTCSCCGCGIDIDIITNEYEIEFFFILETAQRCKNCIQEVFGIDPEDYVIEGDDKETT